MRFIVTEKLRPYDAGIMELGLVYTDKMAIPPNQNRFPLHGYCLPECSAVVIMYNDGVKKATKQKYFFSISNRAFLIMVFTFLDPNCILMELAFK